MEFLFLPVTCFSARMQLTPLECIKAEIFALFDSSNKSVAGCNEAGISLRALEYEYF